MGKLKHRAPAYRGCGGLTLLELCVIALVVAVLAVFAVPQLSRVAEQRRAAQAVARMEAIKKAEAMHYALHGAYTASMPALAVEVPEVDDGLTGEDDGQWSYVVTVTGGGTPAYTVTATRVTNQGRPGTVVWDSSAGSWGGTHPLRPR